MLFPPSRKGGTSDTPPAALRAACRPEGRRSQGTLHGPTALECSASRSARCRFSPRPARPGFGKVLSGLRRDGGGNRRLWCKIYPASGGMPVAATQPIPVRELHDLFERHLRFDFAEGHHGQYALIYRDATARGTDPVEQTQVGSTLLRKHGGCRGRGVSPEPATGVLPGRRVRLPQRTATRHIPLQSGVNGRFRAPVIASRSRSPHQGRDRRWQGGIGARRSPVSGDGNLGTRGQPIR